jgi:hypothetical protein
LSCKLEDSLEPLNDSESTTRETWESAASVWAHGSNIVRIFEKINWIADYFIGIAVKYSLALSGLQYNNISNIN